MRRAGLVALVVLLAAPQARADSTSPLTELVDAAAARLQALALATRSYCSQKI
jgi:chorismate mutase